MNQVPTLSRSDICSLIAKLLNLQRESEDWSPFNEKLSLEFPIGFIISQDLVDEMKRLNAVARRNDEKLWKQRKQQVRRGNIKILLLPKWKDLTDCERDASNLYDITSDIIYWSHYGLFCVGRKSN